MSIVAAFCCLAAVPHTPPDSPLSLLQRSAVWIVAGREGRGSGWLVDRERRWIVTCYHVVGDEKSVDVLFPAFVSNQIIAERSHYEKAFDRLRIRGRVIRSQRNCDLTIIEVPTLPPDARALPLAQAALPGREIHLLGNRRDLETLWNYTRGTLRQRFRSQDGIPFRTERIAKGCRVLALDAPINDGDSGAAAVNDRGEVVGVVSAILWQAQRVALAIDAAELRAFLELPSPPQTDAEPPSPFDRIVRASVCMQSPTSTDRGTGVIVDRKRLIVLTTHSAAGSRERTWARFPHWKGDALVGDAAAYRSRDLTPGNVLARDPRRNLALVQFGSLPTHTVALRLADASAKVGDKLHAVANPNGLEALWLYSAVIVRQLGRTRLSPQKEDTEAAVLILQAPPSGNDSGAPVVNDRGELVALHSGKDAPEQQVGFAVELAELREFLNDHAWALDPKTARDHVRRADFLLRVHWTREAIAELRLALRADPACSSAWLALPNALLRQGDHREALDSARTGLRIVAPAHGSVLHCIIAECLLAAGKKLEAETQIASLLSVDRKCARGYVVRATLARQDGKLEAALKDADEAIWLDPNLAPAYVARAAVHRERKEFQKAISDLGRAIELDPYEPSFFEVRASLNLANGDRTKSDADREAAAKLRRENAAR